MKIEFDPAKEAKNLKKHKVSLVLAERFDWDSAYVEEDKRYDYDEQRMVGLGLIGNQVFHVSFVEREGMTRVFSLRPAEKQEIRDYVHHLTGR